MGLATLTSLSVGCVVGFAAWPHMYRLHFSCNLPSYVSFSLTIPAPAFSLLLHLLSGHLEKKITVLASIHDKGEKMCNPCLSISNLFCLAQ